MSEKTKEQIYDEQIDPLMSQIIAICQEHKITHICSFALDNTPTDTLLCTTAMFRGGDGSDIDLRFKRALALIKPSSSRIVQERKSSDGN